MYEAKQRGVSGLLPTCPNGGLFLYFLHTLKSNTKFSSANLLLTKIMGKKTFSDDVSGADQTLGFRRLKKTKTKRFNGTDSVPEASST